MTDLERTNEPYEPSHPTLLAAALLSLWVLVLSLPLWTGKFLGGIYSDQFHSGYAFREWLAHTWRRIGGIPQWNPELFGGMPFVGAMHGDIFYPTSWLRLVLPTGFAMGLGFLVHYVLAGVFVYWLLRLLRVSWSGALTGGFVYQLSGVIGSYVQPGHDGKLFVTTLLPLALVGLIKGMRDAKPSGYGVLALSVGLAILSPHFQMTYYLLIAAGLFALYLTFAESRDRSARERAGHLVIALAAVMIGFGLGMIQLLPFFEYLPYSPRAEGYYGFEGSTSYAIPWSHIPELFVSRFAGTTPDQTYWGPNPLKLHSEYLGLSALALAALGALEKGRRRTVVWISGLGFLFLLICLGSETPFYRVWWTVMPFVKQTRAPGMALFVVAMVVAVLAGIGVDRLHRDRSSRWARGWMVTGAVVAAMAALGVFGFIAESLATGIQMESGQPVAVTAAGAAGAIRLGAASSGVALLLLGALAWAAARAKVRPLVLALAVPLLVSVDLLQNAAPFWKFSDKPQRGLFAADEITDTIRADVLPFRVLDLSDTGLDVYPGSSLMAFDIPQLLGHHGNQLHAFNELLGGKNQWQYLLSSRRLWDLFAVKYLLLPEDVDLSGQLPAYANLDADFETVLTGVDASSGVSANLLVRRAPVRYARVVPAAIRVSEDQAIPTVANARSTLPFDQLVLIDSLASIMPPPVSELPDPLDVRAVFDSWDAGAMEIRLIPPVPRSAFLLVAENFYPGWEATVDGEPAPVARGNASMLTVPLPAGAETVTLRYRSGSYVAGRTLSWISLIVIALTLTGPAVVRRIRARR